MNVFNLKHWFKRRWCAAWMLCFYASTAMAEDLPFKKAMDTLQGAITGDFLKSASIILFVVTCLMLAFGDWGEGFKRLLNIVLWLSIAFGATSFMGALF